LEKEQGYDPGDKLVALKKAFEWGDRIPEGIIYQHKKDDYAEVTGLISRPALLQEQINAGEMFNQIMENYFI
jgi:hypothetical protein